MVEKFNEFDNLQGYGDSVQEPTGIVNAEYGEGSLPTGQVNADYGDSSPLENEVDKPNGDINKPSE